MSESPNNDVMCLKCGYCLRGLTVPRCPECGTPILDPTSASPQTSLRLPLGIVVSYLLLNVVAYAYVLQWNRSFLFDVGPVLFLYAPAGVGAALICCYFFRRGYSSRRGYSFKMILGLVVFVGVVALGNFLFYVAASMSV
jgi:hypothetical protein